MKVSAKVITNQIILANAAYDVRNPALAAARPEGKMQPDCQHALKTVATITEPQWDAINALNLGSHFVKGIGKTTNVKVVKRIAQVLAFLGGGTPPKGSGRTFTLAVGAVALCKCTGRDGLQFAITGKGNEHQSDQIMTAAARKLQKLGITSPASFATQYSVAFSKDGIADLLGVGAKGKKGEMPTVYTDNPVTLALLKRVSELTEIEMQQLQGDQKDKGND